MTAALLAAVDRLLAADDMNRYPLDPHVESAIAGLRKLREAMRQPADGPVRVYVAAPIGEAPIAELIAAALRKRGYSVESTWHRDAAAGRDPYLIYGKREALAINLRDMTRSEMTVVWTAGGTPRATYGEVTWTLAADKPVVWIQGPDGLGGMIFDADPRVTVVSSVGEEDVMREVGRVARRLRA